MSNISIAYSLCGEYNMLNKINKGLMVRFWHFPEMKKKM